MRTLFLLAAVVFLVSSLPAQVHLNLNFNVESQPVWGPTGYDHVEYYYFPDIEAYYNVPRHMFYYNYQGRWIERSQLPSRYHNFDFYNSYKVVLNEQEPYRNHNKYRDQYSSYKGKRGQTVIRDSRDSKYYVNKNHPEHKMWMNQQKNDHKTMQNNRNEHSNGKQHREQRNNERDDTKRHEQQGNKPNKKY